MKVALVAAVVALLACRRDAQEVRIAADDAGAAHLDSATANSDAAARTLDEDAARRVVGGVQEPPDTGLASSKVTRIGDPPPAVCAANDAKCVWMFDVWIVDMPVSGAHLLDGGPALRCTVHAVTGEKNCARPPHPRAAGEFDANAAEKALRALDGPACGARTRVLVRFRRSGTVARIDMLPTPSPSPAVAACIRAKLSSARVPPFAVPDVPEFGVLFFTH